MAMAIIAAPSCDKVSQVGDRVVAEDIRFILKEDAVYLNSANIRIKHNGGPDAMWVLMQTDDLVTDADELISERVNGELKYTDQIVVRTGTNKSVQFDGLEAKVRYRIIVKAIDTDGNLYGKAASLIFKTRRDPDVWEVNENWTLTRNEKRSEAASLEAGEIVEYENFDCASKDDESYIVLTLTKEDFQSYEKDEDHKDVKRTLFEDFYADFISVSDYETRILKGNKVWKEERLRSGDYVIFMIGLDEEHELSGLYKQFNITIAPEEPTEDYKKWLGWWEISFSNDTAPWTVFIEELDPNMWYKSIGWEPYDQTSTGVMNMPLKIYYSKNSKGLVFISQEVATGSDGSVIYYYGTFPYSTYQTVLDVVNTRIAKASFTNPSASEAVIKGLGMTLTGVGSIEFTYGLFYVQYSSTSASAASFSVPSYPWIMKKIDAPAVTE